MKKNVFKKIICSAGIFLFVFALAITSRAETKTSTKETDGGTVTTVTETKQENRTSGFGAGHTVTREESNSYFNYGTAQQECSTCGSIKETYTDKDGKLQEHSGYMAADENGKTVDIYLSGEGNVNQIGNFNGSTFEDSNSNSSYTYTLLQPLPSDKGELKGNVSLSAYMTWMYKFALALAGFLAVMMITIGGVEYIASGASEKLKSEATGRITNALYGLVLAFGAYLVLYTINPELVTFKNNQFMNPTDNSSSNSDGAQTSSNNNFENTSNESSQDNSNTAEDNGNSEEGSSNADLVPPEAEKLPDTIDNILGSTPTNPLNSGSGVENKQQ